MNKKFKKLLMKEKQFFICLALSLLCIYGKYYVAATELEKLSSGMYGLFFILFGYMTTLNKK